MRPVVKPRPPLPGGPYLVVGLARSGVAAALALRARGEEVIGCDAGAPRHARADRGGREAFGRRRRSPPRCVRRRPCRPRRDAHQEPRRAPEPPPRWWRREPVACPCSASSSSPGGWSDNEFIAVTGTNGKTTTTEWIGHIHREAALPVAVVGNVGTAATSLVGSRLARRRTVVCEASSFQLEDTIAFAPEAARAAQPGARPPGPPRRLSTATSRPSCGCSPTRATMTSRSRPSTWRSRISAAAPAGSCSAGRRRRAQRAGRPAVVGRAAAARQSTRSRCPGAHNRANAMAAAAVCLARGVDADAVADGLRTFRGRRPPAGDDRAARRRGVRQRLQGDQRRLARWSRCAATPAACI